MIQPNNHIDFDKDFKTYTGISGWIRNLFGRAIKVVDDKGHKFYYNKHELLEKLCSASNTSTNGVDKSKLANLMVEVLNPVSGIDLQVEKIKGIFQEIILEFQEKKHSGPELIEKFNQLKNRHLTVLTYQKDELLKNLKVGDLFFKKNPVDTDNIVVKGQKVFYPFLWSKLVEREGYLYSHVAMYLGDGQVAEAVTGQDGGVQVRSIKLEDSRFALDHKHGCSYLVSRCEDSDLAQEAVRIAKTVVQPAKPETEKQVNSNHHKYAFVSAVRSIYHSSGFGIFAKRRYFEQYITQKENQTPMSFMKPKDFFCSNFISYCYQTAESLKVAPKLVGENSKPLKAHTGFGRALFRSLWAHLERWKHIYDLDKHVKMKFDAQWMTPHDFRNFVLSNPTLFNDKFVVNVD